MACVTGSEFAVGRLFLFDQDFDGGEKFAQAGAVELVGLLFEVALGDQDAAVALAEVFKGFGYAGE